jgi:hypothetical protein
VNQEMVSLDALALRINEQQARIEQAWGMTLELAKQAGEMLIEAKRLSGHGNWLPWLEANCRVSASMAEKYVKIAKGWDLLAVGNPEHVPNLSIRDAVKLLAKPRQPKAEPPETIDAEFSEVTEDNVSQPDPLLANPIAALMLSLEAEFMRLPVSDRGKAVEGSIEQLFGFKDQHCDPTTTLAKLREAFPDIPARELRQEVVGFIGQWQYARIRRNDDGQEFIKTEWAEEFVRLQREGGWVPGKSLISWKSLGSAWRKPKATVPMLP